MIFPFYIARRYLFSKKSHNAINIISGISVGGVALAAMAMVCVMSVFNGFRDLVASLFTSFDPQIKVVPAIGKTAAADDPILHRVKQWPGIEAASACVEDHALALYGDRQIMITVKGVDDQFQHTSDIKNILYGDGEYRLQTANLPFGIPGIQLAAQMGDGVTYSHPLIICAPRNGEQINMMNPIESFSIDSVYSPGVVFSVNQKKYDNSYLITSIDFARRLFERQGMITSLELKLKDGVDIRKAKEELKKITGNSYKVLDRYEQQQDIFKIMNIEKVMAYLFLTFIVLIACFNIVGSLSMLIIDKKKDVETLRNLGANDHQIRQIFLFEGRLISLFGATIGIVLGLAVCWGQRTFGWLKLGNSSGNFIIDAYPVSVHGWDILLVFATVVLVGFLSVWYPVRYLSRRLL